MSLEVIRISALIVFNIGLGLLLNTIFPVGNIFYNLLWWVIAVFGNMLIVFLTKEDDVKKKKEAKKKHG